VPDDPWEQLRSAVAAVFASWNSDRARAYRGKEGIGDDLGTAVTVQAMVFGNRGADSGTGVVFTRNPSTGDHELYGDVLFNAQGEDVVSGTQVTEPISALDARLPAVAADLRRCADVLEKHNRDLCDIEFTIEDGRLWMLQVRVGKRSPRAALLMAIEMAEDEAFPLTRTEAVERVRGLLANPPREFVRGSDAARALAVGLPASPGVASGPIVTSSEAAERAAIEGSAPILVRPETSPEDVRGMAKSAGVLTASGGLASHAAVVARGWGIPAVVGASAVTINGEDVRIGEHDVRAGDVLTVDGGTGEVFLGELAGTWHVAPEAATVLAWANELGIEVNAAPDHADSGAGPASVHAADEVAVDEVAVDDLLITLAIKGGSTLEQLLEVISAELAAIEPLIRQMQDDAFIETSTDQLRITPTGKLAAADAIAASRSTANLDEQRAAQLLDQFHALDGRMKAIVTGWQVRDVAGEQVLNDHTDAAYDASLLDDLAALDADTNAWLDPLAKPLRAFRVYRSRLARALELARAGDQRYVASPRVDSYHSVWFELHEHLMRLAGQKRSGTE
jgi:pyruvate,orthophosphate dikinase